jgi:hypothetical protein
MTAGVGEFRTKPGFAFNKDKKNSLTLKQRTPNSCLHHRLNRELEERGEQLDRLLEERGELTKRLEDLEARDREQIKVRLCWEDWCVEGTAGQAAGGEGRAHQEAGGLGD